MKVVLICGILDEPRKTPMWDNLAQAFERRFGGPVFVEREWYHFYSGQRIREFQDRIVAEHDTGEPLILCGHSAGGAIALDVANQFTKSAVRGVITIFSPLSMPIGYLWMLGIAVPMVPIVAFGARWDFIVPYPFTRHEKARAYKLLPTDHQEGLIHDPRLARIIVHYAARCLLQPDSF